MCRNYYLYKAWVRTVEILFLHRSFPINNSLIPILFEIVFGRAKSFFNKMKDKLVFCAKKNIFMPNGAIPTTISL